MNVLEKQLTFTPAEGGARLGSVACQKNTLLSDHTSFVVTTLLHHNAHHIHGSLLDGKKRSIYVTRASKVKSVAYDLDILTDFTITAAVEFDDVTDWHAEVLVKEVLVCTPIVLRRILQDNILEMKQISNIILDSAHLICKNGDLKFIMERYKGCGDNKPRILALTYAVISRKNNSSVAEINEHCDTLTLGSDIHNDRNQSTSAVSSNEDDFDMYENFEYNIGVLERELCCEADFAEDIDTVKRLTLITTKPKELIVEYKEEDDSVRASDDYRRLERFMLENVECALSFFNEHRYDPTEIYGEDMYEELKSIPDPTVVPKQILQEFLYILKELGPYGAEKAAYRLLIKLEKLKIKVPYERHFLLLCVCTTVLVKIRCEAESVFAKYDTRDSINLFSTPKVLRFAEILERFTPPPELCLSVDAAEMENEKCLKINVTDEVNESKIDDAEETALENSKDVREEKNELEDNEMNKTPTEKMLNKLNSCDFKGLSVKIEDRINAINANLRDLSVNQEAARTLVVQRRGGHRCRPRVKPQRYNALRIQQMLLNPDALCAVVYMNDPIMAKTMFLIVVDMSRSNPKLSYIRVLYNAIDKPADPILEPKDYEQQRRKQEEVLKKFRMHECNLLLATSALEEGIDLPRCNLVLRWDMPPSYRSYCICRSRARAPRSIYAVMTSDAEHKSNALLHNIGTYRELDQIIGRKCGCGIQNEPPQSEEAYADRFTSLIRPYSPDVYDNNTVSVDLSTAISLINRYCGKLPSDTFTRLAPQWWVEELDLPLRADTQRTVKAFVCTLRLPLNCPVKYNIVGHPMPTVVLARRMVALQACRILHKSGELDNQLMPIGKENFKVLDSVYPSLTNDRTYNDMNDLARPGTTKRRQYYYKRTARAFTDCQPIIDMDDSELSNCVDKSILDSNSTSPDLKGESQPKRNVLYSIVCVLWCALPERYNTRGRTLHAPQNATQALAILMATSNAENINIPAFPVYTRSGEVRVSLEQVPDADVRLTPRRGRLIRRFMRFVFAEVLRVRRRGMKLQNEGSTHNNYYIVPTVKKPNTNGTIKTDVDWDFLELIYKHTEEKKHCEIEKTVFWHQEDEEDEDYVNNKCKAAATEANTQNELLNEIVFKSRANKIVRNVKNPLLKEGEVFVFDPDKYIEAVVTPWYRNQDQPQYFLVAEICYNLTPDSSFPSDTHTTFKNYYTGKYGVDLTQINQPLLDVDHTSARLNLLTPRYVNRKGVALPVSSERTRRAKRDRLDQKQILVPELCRVHPFTAPLWFATVALPCVLYRINALLIADEIRTCVAIDVGLGIPKINEQTCPGFEWPALDFGWSLTEVLNSDLEKIDKKKEENAEEMQKERCESQVEMETSGEKTVNDILQEKEDAENEFEIGMWSNDMASSIPVTVYDEFMEPLPSNLTLCTSATGGTNWCDPVPRPKNNFNPSSAFSVANSDSSYMSSDFDTDDSDFESDSSDDDNSGFCSSKNSNAAIGIRIEYKTAHEAEAVDLNREKKTILAPQPDPVDDAIDRTVLEKYFVENVAPVECRNEFRCSVEKHKREIRTENLLIQSTEPLPEFIPKVEIQKQEDVIDLELLNELIPYEFGINVNMDKPIELEVLEANKRVMLERFKKGLPQDLSNKYRCFSMKDVDIDKKGYVNEKISNIGFDSKEVYERKLLNSNSNANTNVWKKETQPQKRKNFDFDYQPVLEGHPGPSPSLILQALTMSNANDGINLERLETIGDSFLKFAITAFLYCAHPTVHEGKLSHMRSKQVSNLSLYRLGRNKKLGARMIASKFEPHDNWLPPCHKPPPTLGPKPLDIPRSGTLQCPIHGAYREDNESSRCTCLPTTGCFIPYNLITQHSIPDKSIADCVEALIGAYLIECGPRGALLFMSWLGIQVLPRHFVKLSETHEYVLAEKERLKRNQKKTSSSPKKCTDSSETESECSMEDGEDLHLGSDDGAHESEDWCWNNRLVGSLRPYQDANGDWIQPVFGELKAPPSPLLRYIEDPEGELEQMLAGYDALERTLQYRFKDRSLLLQALTHASYQQNRLTDCYQRLEFLGDAILDYLTTRYLYEDERRHSPGALTDLRSALVNNTIFATLAVRHGFHKYFRHMSPGLNDVLTKYVKIQEENGHSISEEHYLIQEDEMEQAEDVEVPKALGDLFESVAGAIFLDSDMSLGAVWRSYENLMGAELEAFSACAPKSPVRELLEAEPDTAKFGKPERLADGRRVRVCVEVFGRGTFKGIGRNYRIAKGTAARCALRHLKKGSKG